MATYTFSGEKITEYKDGNTEDNGTLALGSTFEKEFTQLYQNDNALNEAKVNRAGDTITGDLTINGKTTLNGDVAIKGSTTTISTTNTTIKDNTVTLNDGEAGAAVSATDGFSGIEISRGTGTWFRFGFLESAGRFVAGLTGSLKKLITEDDTTTGTTANKIPYRDSNGALPGNITGNADTVDGYHANTGTIASTVPVRNASGALSGNITGNADTVDGYHANAGIIATTIPVRDASGTITGNISGNADTVDGYHADTEANADSIAVRDGDGDLPGNITGNAATASSFKGQLVEITSSEYYMGNAPKTTRYFDFFDANLPGSVTWNAYLPSPQDWLGREIIITNTTREGILTVLLHSHDGNQRLESTAMRYGSFPLRNRNSITCVAKVIRLYSGRIKFSWLITASNIDITSS